MSKQRALFLSGVLLSAVLLFGGCQDSVPSAETASAGSADGTTPTSRVSESQLPETTAANTTSAHTTFDMDFTFQVNNSMPAYICSAVIDPREEASDEIKQLKLTLAESGTLLQTIDLPKNEELQGCDVFGDSPVQFVDATFDGNTDIIISYQWSAYHAWYRCFVWDAETERFAEAPSFSKIIHPDIHPETKQILSHGEGGGIASYDMYRFDAQRKDFVCTNSLYWEWSHTKEECYLVEKAYAKDGTEKVVADMTVKGWDYRLDETDPLVKPYYQKGGLWELDSGKWKDCR